MEKVLFVCIQNSARNQMAEAFLNRLGKDEFDAESAGLEPGTLIPLAVESMKEIGYDISGNMTKSVLDFYRQGRLFSYVITVCDESASERCPVFPGNTKRLHWSFPDPSNFTGTHEVKSAKMREVRDMIRDRVSVFIKTGR
jgi:arsenate reductase (thioredoxin)